MSTKTERWDGINKARVRLFKLNDIRNLINLNRAGKTTHKYKKWLPNYLTFAGSEARFEKLLINNKLAQPKNIVTIQTYQKLSALQNGHRVLQLLNKECRGPLNGMTVWPYNFLSFSKNYLSDKCNNPNIRPSILRKYPIIKTYLRGLESSGQKTFDVLDIDLCGIFNKTNTESILNLFKHSITNKNGLLFVTHLKGRDGRGGKLFELIDNYFDTCPHISDKSRINYKTKKNKYDFIRYKLVPLYYTLNAHDLGYTLHPYRLIEYRDRNKESNIGVNMLQFFFLWEKFKKIGQARCTLQKTIEMILSNKLAYHAFID